MGPFPFSAFSNGLNDTCNQAEGGCKQFKGWDQNRSEKKNPNSKWKTWHLRNICQMHNGNNWMGGRMAARHTEAPAGYDTDVDPVRRGSSPACAERGPAPVEGRDRTVPWWCPRCGASPLGASQNYKHP